tara:strand:+ start:976 stop:1128 length:153 start_codon:yes stop_codon:yes gene_type:complete
MKIFLFLSLKDKVFQTIRMIRFMFYKYRFLEIIVTISINNNLDIQKGRRQ